MILIVHVEIEDDQLNERSERRKGRIELLKLPRLSTQEPQL